MTTIVYRDGIMVADTRAYSGSPVPIGKKTKIKRLDDGSLVGASTATCGAGEQLVKWVEAGADPESCPMNDSDEWFEILWVKPNGDVLFAYSQPFFAGPLEAEYFAIGSGQKYAYGAFGMGADAIKACEIGAMFDEFTAGPFTVLTL